MLLLAIIGFVAVSSAAARGLSEREGARRTHLQPGAAQTAQQPQAQQHPMHPSVTPSTCSEQVAAVRNCAASLTPIINQIFDKLMANQVKCSDLTLYCIYPFLLPQQNWKMSTIIKYRKVEKITQ